MPMTPETRPPPRPIDNVSDGGDDGLMEKRIEKLEIEIAAIKLDVEIIKATCATKSDLAELKASLAEVKTTIVLWVFTTVVLGQILPGLLKKFGLL